MEDIILICRQCNELFCPTRYDTAPSYSFDQETDEIVSVECDDLHDFRDIHRDHDVVEFHVIDGSFCSHYAYWEPIREDYFLASDGTETYTIRRYRRYINEPLKYQIVDFEIVFEKPILKVQEKDLKKQMSIDSTKYNFNKDKIKIFVRLYKSFVSRIELEDLVESGFSRDNPMIVYAKLKAESMGDFLNHCQSVFNKVEIENLRCFISENSEYNDVMNIQITKPYQLKPVFNRFQICYSTVNLDRHIHKSQLKGFDGLD